jgi:acyl-CoA synthetase (AMP-forming)/AMP-acid ligase II
VRGPVVAGGHWAREDLDRQAYAGGWLHTGRRGVVELGPGGREHVFVTAG